MDYFCLGHGKKKAWYTLPTVIIVWNVSHLFAPVGWHFRLHQKKSGEVLMNKKLSVSTDAFLPEENSRSFQSCCEIKCSMSISFTGCSFTKVTDDTVSSACSFYCIGIARCCNGRITRCFVTDILYLIFLKNNNNHLKRYRIIDVGPTRFFKLSLFESDCILREHKSSKLNNCCGSQLDSKLSSLPLPLCLYYRNFHDKNKRWNVWNYLLQ